VQHLPGPFTHRQSYLAELLQTSHLWHGKDVDWWMRGPASSKKGEACLLKGSLVLAGKGTLDCRGGGQSVDAGMMDPKPLARGCFMPANPDASGLQGRLPP